MNICMLLLLLRASVIAAVTHSAVMQNRSIYANIKHKYQKVHGAQQVYISEVYHLINAQCNRNTLCEDKNKSSNSNFKDDVSD